MERISLNVTYAEAVQSHTAIRMGLDNTPSRVVLENMKRIAERVFERVRYEVCGNRPLAITSFFRHAIVNQAVGGSTTSQHCKGEAIDLDADVFGNGSNRAIFDFIRDHLEFDQLIWEFGTDTNPAWVHVSLVGGTNRKQVLRSYKQSGRTIYKAL